MILRNRNEKNNKSKFTLLKVASDKKFGQQFPQHRVRLRPLSPAFPMAKFFVIERNQSFFKYFTDTIDFNKHVIDIFINDTWRKY